MDDRLTDIQDRYLILGKYARQTGCQSGLIFTGNIDKDDFSHFGLTLDYSDFLALLSIVKSKPLL